MAYLLEFDTRTVVPFLLSLDLCREGRINLAAALTFNLRHGADVLRLDATARLAPGSSLFNVGLVFGDPAPPKVRYLRFIVDDAQAVYGILRVVFVDEVTT